MLDPPSAAPAEITLHDEMLQRRVTLTGSGAEQVFVWRPEMVPGGAGASDPDMDDAASEDFVLVGLVCARRHIVRLMPGQTHEILVRLHAEGT